MKFKFICFAIAFYFLGCVSIPDRGPSSVSSEQLALANLYDSQLDLDLLRDRIEVAKLAAKHSSTRGEMESSGLLNSSETELSQLEQELDVKSSAQAATMDQYLKSSQSLFKNQEPGVPFSISGTTNKSFARKKDQLVITSLKPFVLENNFPSAAFVMNQHGAIEYQLQIENYYFSKNQTSAPSTEPGNQPFLEASMTCDGPFVVRSSFATKKYPGPSQARFRIYDSKFNGERIKLIPTREITECRLFLKNPDEPKAVYAIRLIPDRIAFAENRISEFSEHFQACVLPKTQSLGPVERYFLTDRYSSMTCPQSVERIRSLSNPYDGLKAKIEALLGQTLPNSVIEKQDPYVALDFSKAPHLDQILVSYLVFRSDFYGTLLARAMEFHAQRGTVVRVMMSEVITQKKDRDLLYGLASKYPNFQVKEYKWDAPQGSGVSDLLSEFHKTLHVKIFLTYSSQNSTANQVVIGGRNIHDGFVFLDVPNHAAFGSLIQYGKGKEENFIHWQDFEAQIKDTAFVNSVGAHFMNVWDHDSKSFFMRSLNLNIKTQIDANPTYFHSDKALVRHFVSTPYKDNMALERLYAELLDSAQSRVEISTPYFRPTKILGSAFDRALKRGVKIRLITRLNLEGDTADFILSDVNKAGVNKYLGQIELYEYTEPKVILHSKIVIVDEKLSMIGSVNLNQRSFVHDLENAVMVYSPAYAQELTQLVSSYRKIARPIVEKQKIRMINRIILGLPMIKQAL